jgi:hypothetical protein
MAIQLLVTRKMASRRHRIDRHGVMPCRSAHRVYERFLFNTFLDTLYRAFYNQLRPDKGIVQFLRDIRSKRRSLGTGGM